MNLGQGAVAFGTIVAAVISILAYRQSHNKDSATAQGSFIDDLQEDRRDLRDRVKDLESTFDARLSSAVARVEAKIAQVEAKLTAQEVRCDAKLKDQEGRLDVLGRSNDQLKLELIRMRRKYGENGD